jgi:hypothetical protein
MNILGILCFYHDSERMPCAGWRFFYIYGNMVKNFVDKVSIFGDNVNYEIH